MSGTTWGPGSVLAGRFTLDDLLDESGGARLWRATDRVLARSVAVHVLPVSDPRADALLAAARTSALVSDGHLLRVLDAATSDGVVYVVNEWGSGVSLDQLLAEGPLSARRAAWVVKEVAETISTAHRNGVAHGRLLPENVMVTEAGSVKVSGFVIDAVLRADPQTDDASGGLPDHPANRRVTGGDAIGDHEADVVNLAGLLYAALVGRWPGTEGSGIPPAPTEHGRPLRPRQVRAGVPRPLDAICERVLNPDAHPHVLPVVSAHEVYAALSDFIGDPTASPQPGEPVGEPDVAEATALLSVPGAAAGADPSDGAEDTSELSGAVPTGTPDPGRDPEATQAATPVFRDESPAPDVTDEPPTEPPAQEDDWSRAGPAPAPAPRLPDPPLRPLFADDAPSRAGVTAGFAAARAPYDDEGASWSQHQADPSTGPRSTGVGNGWVPPTWGPDPVTELPEGTEGWDEDDRDDRVPGRTWLKLAVVLAVVLAVGVLTAFVLDFGRVPGDDPETSPSASGSPSTSASASRVLSIVGVTDFDPQGDPPRENPELAELTTDGDKGTAWQTSTYYDPIDQLKDGVGLLVDLGEAKEVGEVRITLQGEPTSLELLAAPDGDAAPASTDGLTTLAKRDDAGAQVSLKPRKAVTTQYLVVWLTSLPSASGGFQGKVAEISVRS